ncbi:MAG: radical SAM protein [Oscillospiraceae bacterium]|nr:radical SAM protein [Oscillospiraceae bacterium]
MAGIMEALLNRAARLKLPASGTFELTARCNLDCKMCYIHKKAQDRQALAMERPTAFWLDLVEQLKKAGTLTLLLTGGEPFLRQDFREIYLAAKKAGFVVILNSNGSLLNDSLIAFLAQNPPARINISLYGASRETYGALCGREEIFDLVTENIRKLRARGLNVILHYTVTPYNRRDAEAIYGFARELGIRVKNATYMFPPLRSCETGCAEAVRMSAEEAAEATVDCLRYRLTEAEFRQQAELYAQGAALPMDPEPEELRAPGERLFCRAGGSSFWITYDGRLLPCGLLPQPAILLDGLPFPEAWERLKAETLQINLPKKCVCCSLRSYCEVCAANCYGENGNYEEPPEYICRKTKATVQRMAREAGE